MKQIQGVYLEWLVCYCQKKPDPANTRLLEELRGKFANVSSIQDLIRALEPHTNGAQNVSPSSSPSIYGSITIYGQLSTWKKDLDTVLVKYETAREQLEELERNLDLIPSNTHDASTIWKEQENKMLLVAFLKKILSSPNVLLHPNINSFINVLAKIELAQILSHIISYPTTELRRSFRGGSYMDNPPVDSLHEAGITFLNNLTANHKVDSLFDLANGLLQNGNTMYADLYGEHVFEDIPLNNTPPTRAQQIHEEKREENSGCVIS